MWPRESSRRIFAFTEPTDIRKSFQGLLALVQHVFRDHDPHSDSLYVFVNRRGNFLKAIAWDRTGFVLVAKKLEHGRFVFPDPSSSQELSEKTFRFLLDGIRLGIRR